ncbi:hypothetical protein TNCV_3900981 [Trichonephila clavipes]|nr:hypothetical protein TNCV_3900981 [Trichonephila clavipes]
MRLPERKGTVDGYEWRCRSQSKDNPTTSFGVTEGVRCFPFETGIHCRRETLLFPEADTAMPYSGFEPEPARLQAEGHIYRTDWAARNISSINLIKSKDVANYLNTQAIMVHNSTNL